MPSRVTTENGLSAPLRTNRSVSYAGMTASETSHTTSLPLVHEPSFEELESSFSRNVSFRRRKTTAVDPYVNGYSMEIGSSKSTLDIPSMTSLNSPLPTETFKFNNNKYKKQRGRSSTTTTSPEPSPIPFNFELDKKSKKSKKFFSNENLNQAKGSSSSDSEDPLEKPPRGIHSIEEVQEVLEMPKCPAPMHSEGKEVLNAVYPCSIDQLFTMLFTDSKFFTEFHLSRKTTDITQSAWEVSGDGKEKTRKIEMTVLTNNSLGPKTSRQTETLIMLPVSKPGLFYAIDSENVSAGVPYADSFYVAVHYCLSRVSANESKLLVISQMKYRKFVLAKPFIQKHGQAGLDEFYGNMGTALQEYCENMKPNLKSSSGTVQKRRNPRREGKNHLRNVTSSKGDQTHLNNGLSSATNVETSLLGSNESEKSLKFGRLIPIIFISCLVCLILLNIFFHLKLTQLESSVEAMGSDSPQRFFNSGETPQSPADLLTILQKQDSLYEVESDKFQQVIMSALEILQKTESDFEKIKFVIGSRI